MSVILYIQYITQISVQGAGTYDTDICITLSAIPYIGHQVALSVYIKQGYQI